MSDTPETSLTKTEQAALAHCETAIERGCKTFVEVGSALLQIRDERLYRAAHKTFATYCRERWDFTPKHASCLVGSAEVVAHLETLPMGNVLPTNERQARPLLTLRSDDGGKGTKRQIDLKRTGEVWQAAVEIAGGTEPTAKQVGEAMEDLGYKEPSNPKNKTAEGTSDHTTDQITFEAVDYAIRKLRDKIKALAEHQDGVFINQRHVFSLLNDIRKKLRESRITQSRCPRCKGTGCVYCHSVGKVPKQFEEK